MNKMRDIRIEKVTLNIGAGKDQVRLERGMKLLKNVTGLGPVKTFTNKRIPTWGIRPGLPIGCKITLRGKKSIEELKRLIKARGNKLAQSNFSKNGNIAFGIHEYIDIPGVEYDPEIKIMGLEVCITLERPGFRIKRRKYQKTKIPKKHSISKQEAINFMKEKFNVEVSEAE